LQRKGLAKFLGELEARVMEEVWARNGATVREVWRTFVEEARAKDEDEPAYTTILTVMQNLAKKGILEVKGRAGRSYFYAPCCSKEEFVRSHVQLTLKELLEDFPEEVFSTLLSPGTQLPPETVERFRKLLDEHHG
jgi:predicted transcriptional regulator